MSIPYVDHAHRHLPGGTDPLTIDAVAPLGQVVFDASVTHICYTTDRDGNYNGTFWNPEAYGIPFPELRHPIDFAYDRVGNIYVVDNSLSTVRYPIQVFSPTGVYLQVMGTAGDGSANGQCDTPGGIAFSSVGDMYIADAGNDRVQRWSFDGFYISKWGSSGTGNGQFDMLGGTKFTYMAFDTSDVLYVCDPGNHRIQYFSATGTYFGKWGSSGTGNGQFTTLNGIALALDGTIYVVDDYYNPGTGNNSRIQHFQYDGTFIDQYISPSYSNADGCFMHPNGIAIDEDDCIYVVSEYAAQIQKLQLPGFDFIAKWDIPPDTGANPQGIAVRPSAISHYVWP